LARSVILSRGHGGQSRFASADGKEEEGNTLLTDDGSATAGAHLPQM